MKANKGYANRAKSGDKASIARLSQKAAQARLEKTGGRKKEKVRSYGDKEEKRRR